MSGGDRKDEDKESLVREILGHLDAQVVKEIDFMPVSQPPYVAFESSTLGIAMTQLKGLYAYAYQKLLSCIESAKKASALSSQPETLWADLHKYSLVALTIKGDLIIAYAARKRLLTQCPQRLNKEFLLLQAIFSKHPKSPSGWEHRRWCYRQLRSAKHSDFTLSIAEVETEKALCQHMAEKYPKNYYAWMHRLWLLPFMTAHQMDDELFALYAWLRTHISDHSAAHHLVGVVTRIADNATLLAHCWRPVERPPTPSEEGDRLCTFLSQQWEASGQLLVDRPGHDSLWSLRTGLYQRIQGHLPAVLLGSDQRLHTCLQRELRGLLDTVLADVLTVSEEGEREKDRQEGIGSCLLDLLAREVRFVRRQVVTARTAREGMWNPQQQVLAALRALLFMLRPHLVEEGSMQRVLWGEEYRAIVLVVQQHDRGSAHTAYIEAISSPS